MEVETATTAEEAVVVSDSAALEAEVAGAMVVEADLTGVAADRMGVAEAMAAVVRMAAAMAAEVGRMAVAGAMGAVVRMVAATAAAVPMAVDTRFQSRLRPSPRPEKSAPRA